MSFNQWLLFKIPTSILGILIVGSAVILSVAGLLIVRMFVPQYKLKLHNDIAGPIFATLGVVYAVLLAFVVVIVWQNFDRSNSDVQDEANCLVDMYRDAEAFPSDFRNGIRALVEEYAQAVVNDEWRSMERGESSPLVRDVLKNMWSSYSGYEPKTEAEKTFYAESVRKMNELGELRRMRLMDSRTGVHSLLWFVLIVGAIVTITFTFFFGSENLTAQVIMALLLAVLISLILFTILAMDFPFTGSVSISPEPFKQTAANW
jgi:ABC-type multidrug transport system fused ATPase/permease subunit